MFLFVFKALKELLRALPYKALKGLFGPPLSGGRGRTGTKLRTEGEHLLQRVDKGEVKAPAIPASKEMCAIQVTHNLLESVIGLSLRRWHQDHTQEVWVDVAQVLRIIQECDEAENSLITQPATVRLVLQQWVNCGVVILNQEQTKVTCVHLRSVFEASSREERYHIALGCLLHAAWRPDCVLDEAFLRNIMKKN